MPVRFETNFTLPEMKRAAYRAVHQEVHLIGQEMERDMVDQVKAMGISYNRDLEKGIRAMVQELKTRLRLEVGPIGVKHAWFVYAGTRPHWPPRRPIRRWVKDKLGISDSATVERQVRFWDSGRGQSVEFTAKVNKLESVTRAVMHKIATKGTEGRDFLTPVLEKWLPRIPERIEAAYARGLEGSA